LWKTSGRKTPPRRPKNSAWSKAPGWTGCAMDNWNAADLVNRLVKAGAPMVQFIQGPKSYHPAMQELERAYTAGNFNHLGNPVLTWNASNMVAHHDRNLNMAPDRKRAADKIDGLCCVLMGIGTTLAKPETKPASVYESRGLRMV
jgi:phage terminase large subunit-like protein